ncbi:MAG: T9SS type A sorting domain-containing protein [Chitinophagaceae bacterium]|nr:T9SS type A sorting domain-containing protein [Chitinophagaceae bacterium]
MQPKFTQLKLGSFCAKMVTILLFLVTCSQLTSAQNLPGAVKKPSEKLQAPKNAKQELARAISESSVGRAPVQTGANKKFELLNPTAGNPASRAFCYNGAGPFQLNKQSLLNTTLTTIGAPVAFGFPGAAAWNTTNGKLYVVDQAAPFALYTVDTLTGIRTFVVNCTGAPQTNLTGMTWDATTNTMYGASTSIAASSIFTINLTTGVCTPIGAPTAVAPGVIMLNAAPGGSLFAVDIVNDALYRFNKTTGVPTLIGPLGFNANFGQDGHFDPSDGQYFYACFNATAFLPQLRIIDTLTGSSTLVGNYGPQVETFSIFSAPTTPCAGTPAPGNTLCSASPAACTGVPFILTLQNNPYVILNHQWQSSPTGVAGSYVNIPGSPNSPVFGTSQTAATWYRCNVTCPVSGITTASNPVFVADGQGVFNTQPVSASTQCSGNASFSFTATGAALVYGWEYRITPASPWLTVTNGPLYSGALTNTLTITGAASTMNGYQYRGLISGPCTAVDFSNVATLTVTPLVASVNISSATICTGTIQALTLTNASSATTATFASATPLNIQIPDLTGPPASSAPVVEAGINHTIPVVLPAGAQVFQIDVKVNISHTYASDLKIVLKNTTTNQVINLFYHKSGAQTAGANFTNTKISSAGTLRFSAVAPPFTNTFRADLELNPGSYGDAGGAGPTAFQPTTNSWSTLWGGVNQGSGNWTLAINDSPEWAGDIGTLINWSMDITYGAPASGIWSQSSPATPPNTMFTDPAATVAYVAGSLANTIYVKPTVNSVYCVTYSTATPSCTSAPTCIPINVTNPIVGLAVSPATRAVCLGQGTTFTATTTSGGPLTYVWQVSIDGGITYNNVPGGTSQTLTLTNVDQLMNNNKYRVIVTAAPCGTVTSANFGLLTTIQLPVVSIGAPDLALTPGQTTTITATSSPAAASYAWTRNGSSIGGPNTNTRIASVDSIGTYRVSVIDINGCTSNSNNLVIGSEQSDRLWLYPNPTTGAFTVRLFFGDALTENRFVSVYNPLGQVVATKEIVLTNVSDPYTKIDFDLSKQAAGTYVVKVAHKRTGKVTSGLIVKQ